MKRLTSIIQQTDNKWLNLYKVYYEDEKGNQSSYEFASRRSREELAMLHEDTYKSDAVMILPYFEKEGKTYVVFIQEFREPINQYSYGVPAGLIEKGESAVKSAVREIFEEIGGKVLEIEETDNGSYSSAGLTDEKISCFTAKIELTGKQHLESTEDILIKIVELSKLPQFVKNNQFTLPGKWMAKTFYLEKTLEKLKESTNINKSTTEIEKDI